MNQSLTLCCAICILLQNAGVGQTAHMAGPAIPAQGDLQSKPGWTVFSHPVLGFELPVPPGVNALGTPERSSTGRFVSPDERFTMTVHGAVISGYPPWVLETNWKQAIKLQPGRSLDSHRKSESSFAVSGTDRNGTRFFQKFIVDGNRVATLTLTCSRSRPHEFDSWATAIQDRFRIVPPPPPPSVRLASESPDPGPMVNLTPPKRTKVDPIFANTAAFASAENLVLEVKTTPQKSPAEDTPTVEPRLPYGVKVEGKPGFVYSPYGAKQIVDVVDLSPGIKVKCPYTNLIFRVP